MVARECSIFWFRTKRFNQLCQSFQLKSSHRSPPEAVLSIKKQPPEVFVKKGVLENFANFTGKHLCWSLFLIKLQGSLTKKRLQHRCFPVKFEKILRTPILKNIYERVLLLITPYQSQRKIRQLDWISGRENDAALILRSF